MKALFVGLLLASPAVAAWVLRESDSVKMGSNPLPISYNPGNSKPTVRLPVEVLSNGSTPRWVYVDVGTQAVPEPGMISIVAVTGVLMVLRRKRD